VGRRHGLAAVRPFRIASFLALIGFLGFVSFARAEDVSPFLNLDAGACDKLDDKNLQVGPPDADIVAACAALHRGAVLGQRFSGGPGGLALLVAGLVLTYAVIGVPLRSVAGLMGRAGGRSTALLSLETPLALVLRGCVGLAILAILSLPYAIAGGCLVMLAAAILSLRKIPAAPSQNETAPAASRAGVVLADMINDVYASAASILGIVLLSRRDPWWLAFGLALALLASIPAVIAARRRLRREPMARIAATAALAALFGATALADPDLSTRFGDAATPALASALIFALAVLGAGWWVRANPRSPAPAGS
jgi:hypothetical protein